MPKKPRKLDVTKEVKSIARERVGSPPPARVIEEKKVRTKPKHKKQIATDESP